MRAALDDRPPMPQAPNIRLKTQHNSHKDGDTMISNFAAESVTSQNYRFPSYSANRPFSERFLPEPAFPHGCPTGVAASVSVVVATRFFRALIKSQQRFPPVNHTVENASSDTYLLLRQGPQCRNAPSSAGLFRMLSRGRGSILTDILKVATPLCQEIDPPTLCTLGLAPVAKGPVRDISLGRNRSSAKVIDRPPQ